MLQWSIINKIMEITHLVVNGCSWSSGEGLPDPKSQAWATLLANKLNCKLVNLSVRGSSNDAIVRRSYEYTYENLSNNSKPLYIIVFSQIWRREAWYNIEKDFRTIDYTHNELNVHETHPHTLSLVSEFNEEDFYRCYIMNKLYLKSLLTTNNYPHLITHFPSDHIQPETISKVRKRFPNMVSEFEKIEDYDLSQLSLTNSLLPCGHPGIEGQKLIADKMYDELIKKFEKIQVIPDQNFLYLKDFNIARPGHIPFHIKVWM
jgi:hypothetical protein